MTCRDRKDEFNFYLSKPGFINQCANCAQKMARAGKDVEKLGGNMVWARKTAPEIEIKPMFAAVIFANKQKRLGHGVIRCITESKESQFREGNAHKAKTGSEAGAMYFSSLGEKRTIKR